MSADSCSAASLAAGESLIGTAPEHTGWVCLEQPGPWGRKALKQSRLDPDIGKRLDKLASAVGVRPSLIRRPDDHPVDPDTRPWVLLAHTDPRDPWLLAGRLEDAAQVLDLDFAALAAGDRSGFDCFTAVRGEVLLVCTNGKRDTCCALLGRPVVGAAHGRFPDRVWEITHTSGHRFAPTTVMLPSGHLHGRVLDGASLLDAADRGELVLDTWRGRTSWPSDGQAAEALVRRHHRVGGLHDLSVEQRGQHWRVHHIDGRHWEVTVSRFEEGSRAESCGKKPAPVVHRVARFID